jgi:hypothetical protein
MSPADASTGLKGSAVGLTEHSPGPRPRIFQVWATINGSRICVFASPDADAALLWARDQIRHGGDSRCTRVEVRAISDAGTKVIWESK